MPNNELVVNRARSASTATPGRAINHVRDRQLLIDEPTHLGGPGEEVTPADAFLAGVSACGVLLVHSRARETSAGLDQIQVAYHQTVVQEIRTEIKEQEVLMDRLYDDRLHRLISEDFFRQRFDLLEEKHRQLSRDLARHQHAEGAYMELGSKLIELIAQAPQIFERADPEQRRELVGLLTSNRVMKGKTLEFELRKPFDVLVSAANRENGWGGRIRTLLPAGTPCF